MQQNSTEIETFIEKEAHDLQACLDNQLWKRKRTITSLRDTGYSAETAIADIIDNSIEAEATSIEIILNADINQDLVVDILDIIILVDTILES